MPTLDPSALFRPMMLGDLALPNRVVMAPLTRSRSDNAGVPPPFAADYYAQRATAGLIISEATNISAQARGYAKTPGIWSAAQIAAWQHVTRAVRAQGGRMFLQLWHTGRLSHPSLHDGALPVAPSAIAPSGQAFTNQGLRDYVVPRALETEEIPSLVAEYRHAAECAKQAGFDGVEVHSANNYLLEQFIRDSTNQRTDRYGGSVENRLRFPLAVVAAVVEVWGASRVGIRLSPGTRNPGSTPIDHDPMGIYGAYIDALSAIGLAYVHAIEGDTQLQRNSEGIDFRALRRRFHGAYIANNLLDATTGAEAIETGDADLISFGRPFLANPDLVERLRTGAALAEAPKSTWYGGDARGYADWPGLHGPIPLKPFV